jgi:hypothetical protein
MPQVFAKTMKLIFIGNLDKSVTEDKILVLKIYFLIFIKFQATNVSFQSFHLSNEIYFYCPHSDVARTVVSSDSTVEEQPTLNPNIVY